MTFGGGTRPRVLLCDADDCLFPSEPAAYEASAVVTNEFLRRAGVLEEWTAQQLRKEYTGLNFRATLPLIANRYGVSLEAEELESWVTAEKDAVTAHLSAVLRPDRAVVDPLRGLAEALPLAVVSSSAEARIAACLEVTDLAPLFPPAVRFSAEDSLRPQRSKPDPAIYLHALHALRVAAYDALAVEDSPVGVRAAHAAGVPVVGLLQYVDGSERCARRKALLDAGAATVVASWQTVAAVLDQNTALPATALATGSGLPLRR